MTSRENNRYHKTISVEKSADMTGEKNLTARQRQALETKEKIRTVAIDLFRERGMDNVTIKDICQQAEVSVGNFYHYFESKEAVTFEILRGFDEWLRGVAAEEPFDRAVDGIRFVIREQVTGAERVGFEFELGMFQSQIKMRDGKRMDTDRFFKTYLTELIERAMAEGDVHSSYDSTETAELLLRVSRGILFDWSIRCGSYSIGEKTMEALELLLRALREPKQHRELS